MDQPRYAGLEPALQKALWLYYTNECFSEEARPELRRLEQLGFLDCRWNGIFRTTEQGRKVIDEMLANGFLCKQQPLKYWKESHYPVVDDFVRKALYIKRKP